VRFLVRGGWAHAGESCAGNAGHAALRPRCRRWLRRRRAGARSFRVVGYLPAGAGGHPAVSTGEAVRLLTGTAVPKWVWAVAMQEGCRVDPHSSVFSPTLMQGSNIRRRGEDFRAGEAVLEAGTRLDPRHLAPLVALFSVGDELLEPSLPHAGRHPRQQSPQCWLRCCRGWSPRCMIWACCPTGAPTSLRTWRRRPGATPSPPRRRVWQRGRPPAGLPARRRWPRLLVRGGPDAVAFLSFAGVLNG